MATGHCLGLGTGSQSGEVGSNPIFTSISQKLESCQNITGNFGCCQIFSSFCSFGGITVLLEYNMCLYVEITQSKELKSQFLFSGQPLALKTLNRTERKFNRRSLCLWSSLHSFPSHLPIDYFLLRPVSFPLLTQSFTNALFISTFMKWLDV